MRIEAHATEGFGGFLGVIVTSADRNRVTGQMEVAAHHLNGAGVIHGGALMSFADELGARGAMANLPRGCATTTIESKTNFFRGCGPGLLQGESVPLHLGRRTMVWQTTLTQDAGKPLAIVTQTQMVLEGAAPSAEAEPADAGQPLSSASIDRQTVAPQAMTVNGRPCRSSRSPAARRAECRCATCPPARPRDVDRRPRPSRATSARRWRS